MRLLSALSLLQRLSVRPLERPEGVWLGFFSPRERERENRGSRAVEQRRRCHRTDLSPVQQSGRVDLGGLKCEKRHAQNEGSKIRHFQRRARVLNFRDEDAEEVELHVLEVDRRAIALHEHLGEDLCESFSLFHSKIHKTGEGGDCRARTPQRTPMVAERKTQTKAET